MKKRIYILLFLFGLVVVSCNKQEITPNTEANNAPEWRSSDRSAEGGGDKGDVTVSGTSGNSGGVSANDNHGDITDPNIDPDGE